jgi:hypothetical protein
MRGVVKYSIIIILGAFLLWGVTCRRGGVTPPEPVPSRVCGCVKDSTTHMPIPGTLVIVDTVSDTMYINHDYSDSLGYYSIIIAPEDVKNHPISAFKDGYHPQTKYFSVEPKESVTVNFYLQPKGGD